MGVRAQSSERATRSCLQNTAENSPRTCYLPDLLTSVMSAESVLTGYRPSNQWQNLAFDGDQPHSSLGGKRYWDTASGRSRTLVGDSRITQTKRNCLCWIKAISRWAFLASCHRESKVSCKEGLEFWENFMQEVEWLPHTADSTD